MEKKIQNKELRGLPGGPNEIPVYVTGPFSIEGFRMDSPDVNNYQNIIPSGSITMKEKDGSPLRKGPIHGVDNLGNEQVMYPGFDYEFPGTEVTETLMAKMGGALLDKTIECGNCGWEWKAADGGSDVMDCHKCGGKGLIKAQQGQEIKPPLGGGKYYTTDNKVVDWGTPEYEAAYNRGEVLSDKGVRSEVTLDGGKLDDVVIKNNYKRGFWGKYRDKIIDENKDAGLLGVIAGVPISAVTSLPQLAATYGITGKMERPSEAMDIKNPYLAMGVDALTDPADWVGAGELSTLGRLTKEQALTKLSKIPTSIDPELKVGLNEQGFSDFFKRKPNAATETVKETVKPVKPNVEFSGVLKHGPETTSHILENLRTRGAKWDEVGIPGQDILHPDMVQYHGTYSGRPIVEVKMPDGTSEHFYKSSGWAEKEGAGVNGTTEGMWQVYGGHANQPGASNWFIKDGDYKNYYGSKTFGSIAESMDNFLMNKYKFKDVDELENAFNFQNRNGNVDSVTPKSYTKQDGGEKEDTSWTAYLNPANWGTSRYDDAGTFKEAFRAARNEGDSDFLWKGERYSTELKAEPKAPAKPKGITPELLIRQAYRESAFNPNIVSPAGYKGLGQIGDAVIKDYKKANNITGNIDPFNIKQNSDVQKYSMNELYNSSFINKPGQSENVRLAKTLASYNWGRGNVMNLLNDLKEEGVDIYNSLDWVSKLPEEPRNYINDILLQKNTTFNTDFSKALGNQKNKPIKRLYGFRDGGESKPGPLMQAYNRLPAEKKMGGAIDYKQGGGEKKYSEQDGRLVVTTKKVDTEDGPRYYQAKSPDYNFSRELVDARRVSDSIPKATLNPRIIQSLNKKEFGGQLNSGNITMYKDYVKGNIGNEEQAVKNYDKLNRIYYSKAKDLGMTAANYIMTYIVGNS